MEAPRAEDRFRRLIEIGRGVLAELDIEVVLQHVIEAASELTGARYAALGVLDGPKENLERFIHAGIDEETRRTIGDLPRGRGVLGELIRHPAPLRLSNVGDHPHSFGFPTGHPPMSSFLGVPIIIRGEAYGNLYITEKPGGEDFTEEDEEAMVILSDWAAIAIENARLYTDGAARQTELELVLRQVETTHAISDAIGVETDLDRVLELIVKRARALVEASALAVFLADGAEVTVATIAGPTAGELAGLRQPIHGSEVGNVLTSGKARTLEGDSTDPIRAVVGAEVVLLVPLVFRGEALGVLAAFDRLQEGPSFSQEDLRLLQSFGTSAAAAVAMAQKVEQQGLRERVEAAERERHHWAHELHDETLQQLAATRLQLAGALRSTHAEREEDPLRGAVRQTMDHLEEAIESLSRLINELRPVSLETLGLRRALEALAEETTEQHGIVVDARIDLPEELSPETERAVYRLFQESLTNVVKHAAASSAELDAAPVNGGLTLRIRDDGTGFDPAAKSSGMGLRGMRERIELLGGTFEVRLRDAGGTEVRAVVPLGG